MAITDLASDASGVPAPTALTDDGHPGWASRPERATAVSRRIQEAREQGLIHCDLGDMPAQAVAEAVDAAAAVVRCALEGHGDDEALTALESVLDLSLLERELIEDGAHRRGRALLRVQDGLSKLRAVDGVAEIVDRAPRELVESCGFDRAVLFRVHDGRMVMEAAYFGDDSAGAEKMVAFAQSVAPPLDHMLLETEMIRKRAPAIVRTRPPIPGSTGRSSTSR